MRLLYWFTRFLDCSGNECKYHGMISFELNFSADAEYHYKKKKLQKKPYRTPLPRDFWGNPLLYNLNVIVGNNGVGKTTVIHTVMDTLQELYDRELKSHNESVVLLEDGGKPLLLHLVGYTGKNNQINSNYTQLRLAPGKITVTEKEPNKEEILNLIDRVKIIYLTNTLSEADDARYFHTKNQPHVRANFIYDCSLSGTIRHNASEDSIQSKQADLLQTYFVNEYYKQVKFVCDGTQNKYISQLRDSGLPIPVPKQLSITIRENDKHLNFDFRKNIIELQDQFEIIAFRLSITCFLAYLANLKINDKYYQLLNTRNWKDYLDYGQFSAPKAASYNIQYFNQLFEEAEQLFLGSPTDQEGYSRVKLIKEHCISFISYVFNSKEQFQSISISNNDMEALKNDSAATINIPLDKDTTMEWLIGFMERYRRTCVPYYYLDFSWGLSSGENNLLRLFSSLFYAFDHSGSNLYNWSDNHRKAQCDSVLLFMDEADLTFHPDWQRQLVQIFAAFLPLEFGACELKDLQVVLTTHSPLLLGDIPTNNVTYLGNTKDDLNTFGQNIHTILMHSFFLSDGTVGAFAAKKINDTAHKLRNPKTLTPQEMRECKAVIDLVAPGILKGKLIELYETAAGINGTHQVRDILEKTKKMSNDELQEVVEALQAKIERRKK